MKRRRWVFGAAVVAGVVVLVAPAVGQGKAKPPLLGWSQSRGGATLTSYDFGAVDGGSSVTKGFRLGNSTLTTSGELKIMLTGSSAFQITSDHCTKRSIGRNLSCWVRVAYRPLGAGMNDRASLKARGEHGAAASLSLSGGSAVPSAHIYWINLFSRTVNRVPVGGGAVTTLASVQGSSYSVAADASHVYWANGDGTVNRVPLDGGSVTTLASGQYESPSVAVDGTHVYWVSDGTRNFEGTVNEVPVGGGSVTTLASHQSWPAAVAVDGTNVYWINSGGGPGRTSVKTVPLSGGPVTTLASRQGDNAQGLAVDGTHVYWVLPDDGKVKEVPVGGGKVSTLATGQNYPVAVAVDGTYVYWVNIGNFPERNGTVKRVPFGGGKVTTLATGQDSPYAVAVDGTHVYWTNIGDGQANEHGTVSEVPLGGGSVTTLVTGQNGPYALAVGP